VETYGNCLNYIFNENDAKLIQKYYFLRKFISIELYLGVAAATFFGTAESYGYFVKSFLMEYIEDAIFEFLH
jgi:phosphatidate phosphatase APP1